jgi:hypothetical protein
MKTCFTIPRLASVGVVALLTHAAFAQTWQTVDDFSNPGYNDTRPFGVTTDPSGNLFVVGWLWDASGLSYHPMRSSGDQGITWATSEVFAPRVGGSQSTRAITSDSAGNLYTAGAYAANGGSYLIVALSQDHGLTWNTLDDGSPATFCGAITTDAAGNIYAVGNLNSTWIVRKATAGGTSWANVDSFNPNGAGSTAKAVFCHPTAGVFVAGMANTGFKGAAVATVRRSLDGGATWTTVDNAVAGSGDALGADAAGNLFMATDRWTVRKSSNGGTNWSTVENFQYGVTTTSSTKPYKTQTQYYAAAATGFARDAYGNLFIVGYTPSSPSVWIVRENPGGTGAWQTVDTFQYGSGLNSAVSGVATDNSGHVYVVGHGHDVTGVSQWIVRKR